MLIIALCFAYVFTPMVLMTWGVWWVFKGWTCDLCAFVWWNGSFLLGYIMAIIKTAELSSDALNWTVAKCEGLDAYIPAYAETPWVAVRSSSTGIYRAKFTTDWAQGGPIIEREGISWHCGNKSNWHSYGYGSADNFSGSTPLIAAMRCFVASKLGDSVEVPSELLWNNPVNTSKIKPLANP